MVAWFPIRYILSDSKSLSDYMDGRKPTLKDVKRRLFVTMRNEHRDVPDHCYQPILDNEIGKIDSLPELLVKGLSQLARYHLVLKQNRIFVIADKYNSWQDLITYIPPLILQMAFLYSEKPLSADASYRERSEYFKKFILPNTQFTSIPLVDVPQLHTFINECGGLHDLHVHLNGTVEIDNIWQDALSYPDRIYKELKKAEYEKNELISELLEQEFHLMSAGDIRNLLYCARRIREHLFCRMFPSQNTREEEGCPIRNTLYHPFAYLIGGSIDDKFQTPFEGLMYIYLFDTLAKTNSKYLVHSFHMYLLILGLLNRLTVQQRHQKGFRQFQKITITELRGFSEQTFQARFHQLSGNKGQVFRFLEGRFSPKESDLKNIAYFNKIKDGWEHFVKTKKKSRDDSEVGQADPELKLVAHFIKKADKRYLMRVRHSNLRTEVWEKAHAISIAISDYPELRNSLVGFDVASNELDAPPEVFAPAFRYLRRKGFSNFTYHAGEDFHHIMGGLRAIYEAISFTLLSRGNRIGHAVAAGVTPELWSENVGGSMTIRQGEYLDDLVFAYHLIKKSRDAVLSAQLPFIINEAENLSYKVYDTTYPIHILESAWLLRRFSPKLLLKVLYGDNECQLNLHEKEEFCEILKELNSDMISERDQRVEVLLKYHTSEYRRRYDRYTNIRCEDILSCDELRQLQLLLLKEMADREIVIETLPTSNLRIGHHKDYKSYHLWNWLKWKKEGHAIPPIVVGSDDPGIFSTNIFNEYAALYCCMVYEMNYYPSDAIAEIEALEKNSRVYKFTHFSS